MCGIVDFTGNHHNVASILLKGLSKLDYCGYDLVYTVNRFTVYFY